MTDRADRQAEMAAKAPGGRIPPEFREAFGRLAKEHGDLALLDAMLEAIRGYAVAGAAAVQTKRDGDPSIECPACRAREASIRKTKEALARTTSTAITQGAGGAERHQGGDYAD